MMNQLTGVKIPCKCPFCGAFYWIHSEQAHWDAYMAGALVQDAFPDLTATERESIISGICATCQDEVFGEDEDEEEDE